MIKNFLAALPLALLACTAHADATLDYVDENTGALQTRIAVAHNKLRIDPAGVGGVYVVVDLNNGTLTQVNPQRRTTTSTTIEEFQQILRSLDTAKDPANAPLLALALGSLPPQQRAQLARMLDQSRRDAATPYTATGLKERVDGIVCEVYQQRSETGDKRSVCSTDFEELNLSKQDTHTLESALTLLRQSGGPWVRAAQVPGLPLRYAGSFDRGAFSGSGKLGKRSQAALPADHFADPPGYRIASILEMLSASAPPSP